MLDLTKQIIEGNKQIEIYNKTFKNLTFGDMVKKFKDDLEWKKFIDYYNSSKIFCVVEKETIKRDKDYLFYLWTKYVGYEMDLDELIKEIQNNVNEINDIASLKDTNEKFLVKVDEGFDSILLSEIDEIISLKLDKIISAEQNKDRKIIIL